MLKDVAKKYYLDKGFNCAQAILMAANDFYMLNLTENEMSLIAGFGGGMGAGNACGVLAGAIAVLGKILDIKNANFKSDCKNFVQAFEKSLNGIDCKDLAVKYKNPDTRCFQVVAIGADLLEKFISEKNFHTNNVKIS